MSFVYRPYPLSGTVDTTAIGVDVIPDVNLRLKSLLIQNTHAANNLKVYFLGKGEAFTTLFPKTNISITVENKDRLDIRKIYLQGSAAGTTWEILSIIGQSEGMLPGQPVQLQTLKPLKIHKEECDDVPANSDERVLCEVWHYSTEYKAPPSKADIAYEIGKSPRTEPCIVGAINRGESVVNRRLPAVMRRGLVKTTPYGGYVLTSKGKMFAARIRTRYGIKLR